MATTRVRCHLNAPLDRVYRALIDPEDVVWWKVPSAMTARVHAFEGREGGTFRISLTYEAPDRQGKSFANTDTYHGHFLKLVPNELVVEVDEFETDDPAFQGEMSITISLHDADGGTDLVAVHDGLPVGVPAEDNETGWRESLSRLARSEEHTSELQSHVNLVC